MSGNSTSRGPVPTGPAVKRGKGAALLWDESNLWGLVAIRALRKAGLSFSLMNSADIRGGALENAGYRLLYVPGGWAKNKLSALGADGAAMIRRFVESGGMYAGVCGGAGLATNEGLGLLNLRRLPLKERVPSLSGKIKAGIVPHPVWAGIRRPEFHIWWPSQLDFKPEESCAPIRMLASFEAPMAGTFSSDLPVADFSPADIDRLERLYSLNLDPARMAGAPLVMEGAFGAGRVFITLIHFDTPGDRNGGLALRNLWEYAGCGKAPRAGDGKKEGPKGFFLRRPSTLKELAAPMEELYRFGLRNFLWFPRGWVIQWRRGVRGLEYFTLREMTREFLASMPGPSISRAETAGLARDLRLFAEKAKALLTLERLALQEGRPLTFSSASSGEMAALRTELFGNAKSHGGAFKALLDRVDALLYGRLKA